MAKIKAKGSCGLGALMALVMMSAAVHAADDKGKAKGKNPAVAAVSAAGPKVSYDKQIRPIFQAHCQGCHQPAKAGGGYVMTAFDRMLDGRRVEAAGDRPRQAGREPPRRPDHPAGRQGRDAPGQAAALRGRDRADQPMDRPGGRRRHARRTPGPATTWTIRPSTPGRR